jgi:hypothetical protein
MPEPGLHHEYHDLWVPKRHLDYGHGMDPGDFDMRTEPFHRPHRLHGKGVDAMFGGGPTSRPWSTNSIRPNRQGEGGQRKELIHAHIIGALKGFAHPEEIDTRWLHMSQDSVVGHIVRHYAENPEYADTGVTYADQHQSGNRFPVVYQRSAQGDRTILSGHHRAAAALAQGKPLRAVVVRDDDEGVLNEARLRGYKI